MRCGIILATRQLRACLLLDFKKTTSHNNYTAPKECVLASGHNPPALPAPASRAPGSSAQPAAAAASPAPGADLLWPRGHGAPDPKRTPCPAASARSKAVLLADFYCRLFRLWSSSFETTGRTCKREERYNWPVPETLLGQNDRLLDCARALSCPILRPAFRCTSSPGFEER